jgi:hypothetical protein
MKYEQLESNVKKEFYDKCEKIGGRFNKRS